MKRGRKLVVAFLLFITIEALIYTLYYAEDVESSITDPVPSSDRMPLSEPKTCKAQLFKQFPRNLKKVQGYPIGNSGPYLKGLGLSSGNVKNVTAEYPVIVTAASSNHFSEVKALFAHLEKAVFPSTKPLKVILFDIGLTKSQLYELKSVCKCEIRGFPFDSYPRHVRALWGFAWKPLILQMVLSEYGFVMWLDASTAIKDGSKLPKAFKIAKTHGISIQWSGASNPTSLAASTYTQTFDMLREKPCTFRNTTEFYGTFILIFRNTFVNDAIMRPWVSCALTSGCMYMNKQRNTRCTKNDMYGECHHFDQSVLSIILNRLFYGRISDIQVPISWTKCSGNSVSFLPSFINDFMYNARKSAECKNIR